MMKSFQIWVIKDGSLSNADMKVVKNTITDIHVHVDTEDSLLLVGGCRIVSSLHPPPPPPPPHHYPALIVLHLNSLGSILARCPFRGAHTCQIRWQITSASYQVPTYVYTWVEGSNLDINSVFLEDKKCRAVMGIKLGSKRRESSGHTNIHVPWHQQHMKEDGVGLTGMHKIFNLEPTQAAFAFPLNLHVPYSHSAKQHMRRDWVDQHSTSSLCAADSVILNNNCFKTLFCFILTLTCCFFGMSDSGWLSFRVPLR